MSGDDGDPARAIAREREQLIGEIAARLRPVCQTMPEAGFQAMVERIATITLKYQRYERDGLGHRL